jgi:fucose permease
MRLVVIALVVAVAGLSVILNGRALTAVSAGAFLAGLGLAPVFPTTLAIFARYFGDRAERLIGTLFVLASLGGATLPWLVGFLSSRYGGLRIGLIVPLIGTGVMLMTQTAIIANLANPRQPRRNS